MRLEYLTLDVTVFGNHYLYATYRGESGRLFTPKEPYMWARTKKLLEDKMESYPSLKNVRVVKG